MFTTTLANIIRNHLDPSAYRVATVARGAAFCVALGALVSGALAADAKTPSLEIKSVSKSGLPSIVVGNFGQVSATDKTPQNQYPAVAATVLESVRQALGLMFLKPSDLRYLRAKKDSAGNLHFFFQQIRDGQLVAGSMLKVHVQPNGEVFAVTATADGRNVGYLFNYRDPEKIKAIARRDGEQLQNLNEPTLTYHISGSDGRLRISYECLVAGTVAGAPTVETVYIDADSGKIVETRPTIQNLAARKIYGPGSSVCGLVSEYGTPPLLRAEGGSASTTTLANTNYDHLGTVRQYFYDRFGRRGMFDIPPKVGDEYIYSTINFTPFYPALNAAFISPENICYRKTQGDPPRPNAGTYVPYNLEGQLVFGPDVSGVGISPANALDVTAHEFTHGVTYTESRMNYFGESGALNESFSDMLGAACEIYAAGGTIGTNAWQIGNGLRSNGLPFRYMDSPTSDGESTDFYPERSTANSDNQGVHFNSGIGNLFFKLLVTGGTHPRSKTTVNVSGIGILKAEQIVYHAVTDYSTPTSGDFFETFRAQTILAATALYGSGSNEVQQVANAWTAVGVMPKAGRAIGGSIRSWVGTGSEVQILSIYLAGNSSHSRTLIFRAIGAGLGISGNLANPQITVYKDGSYLDSNDNWATHASASSLGVYTPANSNDSAIYRTNCTPGSYSVVVSGVSGGTGICLAEIFDVGGDSDVYMQNAAGRAKVIPPGTLANASILGGLVLSGTPTGGGSVANNVVVKSAGPSLAAYFPGNYLADPRIDMTAAGFPGLNPKTSDDWQYDVNNSSQYALWNACQSIFLISTPYEPTSSWKEPALHGMPVPGAYVAVVDGVGGTGGIATVEFYLLESPQ